MAKAQEMAAAHACLPGQAQGGPVVIAAVRGEVLEIALDHAVIEAAGWDTR